MSLVRGDFLPELGGPFLEANPLPPSHPPPKKNLRIQGFLGQRLHQDEVDHVVDVLDVVLVELRGTSPPHRLQNDDLRLQLLARCCGRALQDGLRKGDEVALLHVGAIHAEVPERLSLWWVLEAHRERSHELWHGSLPVGSPSSGLDALRHSRFKSR